MDSTQLRSLLSRYPGRNPGGTVGRGAADKRSGRGDELQVARLP